MGLREARFLGLSSSLASKVPCRNVTPDGPPWAVKAKASSLKIEQRRYVKNPKTQVGSRPVSQSYICEMCRGDLT